MQQWWLWSDDDTMVESEKHQKKTVYIYTKKIKQTYVHYILEPIICKRMGRG